MPITRRKALNKVGLTQDVDTAIVVVGIVPSATAGVLVHVEFAIIAAIIRAPLRQSVQGAA